MKKLVLFILILSACNQRKSLTGTFIYVGPDPNRSESQLVAEAKKEMKELAGQEGLYSEITFKGDKTVSIRTLDMDFAASYELDGDYVHVKAVDGNLIFRIEDDNTLIGEGFAAGVYKKGEKRKTNKPAITNKEPLQKKPANEPLKIELKLPAPSKEDSI